MRYAAYKKNSNNRMIPLAECVLFEHEYQAKWFCVMNPGYKYREVKL